MQEPHRWVKTQVNQNSAWEPEKNDARRLSDLVEIWFNMHGSSLAAAQNTMSRLQNACMAMGNPRADQFTAEQFASYRSKRIESGISANNMNREHAYLRAVFNELIRLKMWKKENPLKALRQFKIQEKELSYLTLEQVEKLMSEGFEKSKNPHAKMVTKVCLSTGARWGEAEALRQSQIKDGQIQFVQTKSSKARSVPISSELQGGLLSHHKEHGIGERLFQTAYGAFSKALERVKIELPEGQRSHVLRHSFASHFMMAGGSILALQRVLGHHDLKMTMRYAHLAPEHLQEVKSFNPLALLNLR